MQALDSDKNWQTSCPLQTFVCNISRHLEFIIEQHHRVNWGWVAGSQNVTQFHVWWAQKTVYWVEGQDPPWEGALLGRNTWACPDL